jgi:hypothetical protein
VRYLLLAAAIHVGTLLSTAEAATDLELAAAFRAMMASPEFTSRAGEAPHVRKFPGTIRFAVRDRSSSRRGAEVAAFITGLPAGIPGLDAALVAARPNFEVFVVDRSDYAAIVGREIYGRAIGRAPGRCVSAAASRNGRIHRSVAVIVADEGDFALHRCMVEEILQGLGQLSDEAGGVDSVFNDRWTQAELSEADRLLLAMLYDPRVRPGMREAAVEPLLPDLVRAARARLRGTGAD